MTSQTIQWVQGAAREREAVPGAPASFSRHIHLLYAPTLGCNLSCRYCYLGEQTTTAGIKTDAGRAAATLRHALDALRDAGVLAFNVSLHGGEATIMPPAVLEELFVLIREHYVRYFDELNALGHKKSAPHIKTNLFKFASQYDLFERHKVSVSASIDLPLSLHGKYRTTRAGKDWLQRTRDNIRLLAKYPHAKKISATVSSEHLQDIPAFIDDIWFIHRELGFDMNNFNIMFAFASELNQEDKGIHVLEPASSQQQLALYDALKQAFTGTELEEGFKRNWFDEFKPSYCTNAYNCGERFYLLQSDGSVYSCVRGQGIEEFKYGNIFENSIDEILANGARKISQVHQEYGLDVSCGSCGHLSICHTGCPVVKHQSKSASSYTCGLQKAIYDDNPHSYPQDEPQRRQAYLQAYVRGMHPASAFEDIANRDGNTATAEPGILLPGDFNQEKNTLSALIAADPVLQVLYGSDVFLLELGDELIALESQIRRRHLTRYTLASGDKLVVHLKKSLFAVACNEPIRNTLYLQMLRDTPVVYGDEKRSKQAHLFTYQLYAESLEPSDRFGAEYVMADLAPVVEAHGRLYQRAVANNFFFTTLYLREYHYQKQKNNAFYHIQAVNLPFQNVEFFFLP